MSLNILPNEINDIIIDYSDSMELLVLFYTSNYYRVKIIDLVIKRYENKYLNIYYKKGIRKEDDRDLRMLLNACYYYIIVNEGIRKFYLNKYAEPAIRLEFKKRGVYDTFATNRKIYKGQQIQVINRYTYDGDVLEYIKNKALDYINTIIETDLKNVYQYVLPRSNNQVDLYYSCNYVSPLIILPLHKCFLSIFLARYTNIHFYLVSIK